MAFRLGDLIIAGFFSNSRPLSVHGQILLRGCEDPMLVELTGCPAEDLRGRSFEFEIPENDRPATDEDRERVAHFRDQQIGPVGEMTAALKRKAFDGSAEEFYLRSKLGEPPPVRWCPCLYLEWFSQNGRVVIELLDPQLRFCDDGDAPRSMADIADASESGATPDLMETHPDDECDPSAESYGGEEPHEAEGQPANREEEDYGLIPDELTRELERSARRVDREIAGPYEAIKAIEELEMLDDLIEHGEGTPARKLLAALQLPSPGAALTEAQAWQALSMALAELALFSVAFHICEHCSVQDAYRILIEKICEECTVFPEMRGTSYVQHFSTSDFCQHCQAD